jgi:osmoprotectant transport system ATP-binding protein
MIKLRSVSKTFGTTVVLHETNLDVPTGDTTVLIGPSGCGKSTILKLIMGLLMPTNGSIEIEGEQLTKANILRLRRRIGYVIQ